MPIRDARESDRDFIASCNAALARETESLELDATLLRDGVQALLGDPARGRYFIAEQDGQPVGQLMITYEWSDWRNGVFWWLQSVYVAPAARGAGVFSSLFRHVHALASADPGVCGIRLYVDRGNERAQGVYQRLGLHQTNYGLMETVFRGAESHHKE